MPSQILVLLQKLRDGDRSAIDDLMPLVYGELRQIAQAFMRRQRPGHTLQPTALVHEAFIKLFEDDRPQLADRAHLLALMSRVMRQVLVDHARAQGAAKRGGHEERVAWDTGIDIGGPGEPEALQALELHAALDALAHESPHLAQIVEMHYFGGMTAEESAFVVGRSVHAVRHDLRFARLAEAAARLAGDSIPPRKVRVRHGSMRAASPFGKAAATGAPAERYSGSIAVITTIVVATQKRSDLVIAHATVSLLARRRPWRSRTTVLSSRNRVRRRRLCWNPCNRTGLQLLADDRGWK